jgi:hypothetical protein
MGLVAGGFAARHQLLLYLPLPVGAKNCIYSAALSLRVFFAKQSPNSQWWRLLCFVPRNRHKTPPRNDPR